MTSKHSPAGAVPELRMRNLNTARPHPDRDFVLYWMLAARRTTSSFSLQRAVEWARHLQKPLAILETLTCGSRRDSDRLHRFALDGMADTARRLHRSPVLYYPFVEKSPGQAGRLLSALSRRACLLVTDDFPTRGVPDKLLLAAKLPLLAEAVDSNGLLPMRAAERAFPTAHSFRRFLQRALPLHLADFPAPNPLARTNLPPLGRLPKTIADRFPSAADARLDELPIDHSVSPAPTRGGPRAAAVALKLFLTEKLSRYADHRNHPDDDATSNLSPYLHYGHISPHHVFSELMSREEWSPDRLSPSATGSRTGWWGVGPSAEAFLDQLVTWRELGFNFCTHRDDYQEYQSLPDWARSTLAAHTSDYRPYLYSYRDFEQARTHDPLWNAAQTQLVTEGRLHNYLRMLWGKKILEWSPAPEEALEVMIELNDKYALDGQDPNSYSGILWTLGRYDRPWGPERPIFGKIRYMSSENTARKVRLKEYLRRYSGP